MRDALPPHKAVVCKIKLQKQVAVAVELSSSKLLMMVAASRTAVFASCHRIIHGVAGCWKVSRGLHRHECVRRLAHALLLFIDIEIRVVDGDDVYCVTA